MRLIDYYRLTRITSISCLKISGAIFTSICFIITFIPGTANHTIIDYTIFFIICVLLGNGFGAFILILAFLSGYLKSKDIVDLYNSIPESIRNDINLNLVYKNQNSKSNFLEALIYCDKYDFPIIIEKSADKKKIRIIALSYIDSVDLQNKIRKIKEKYIKHEITLTGWGYCRNVEAKEWNDWDKINFESAFLELIQVTKNETE